MSLSYVLSGTKPRSSKKSRHVKYDIPNSSSPSSSSSSSISEDAASSYTVSTSTGRSHRPGYKRHKKQKKSRRPLDEVVDDYRRAPDGNIGWECFEDRETDEEGRKVKVIVWERVNSKGEKHVKTFRVTKDGQKPKHRKDSYDDSGLGTSISGSSEDETESEVYVPAPVSKRPRHSHRARSRRHGHHTSERHKRHGHPASARHKRTYRSREPGQIHEKSIRIPQKPETNIVLKAGKNIYLGDHSAEPKRHSNHSTHRRNRKTHHRARRAAEPHAWDSHLVQRYITTTTKEWEEPRIKWPWNWNKDIRKNYKEWVDRDSDWRYRFMDRKKGKGIAGRGEGEAPRRPGQYLKSRGGYKELKAY